jgi:hypothetical protein
MCSCNCSDSALPVSLELNSPDVEVAVDVKDVKLNFVNWLAIGFGFGLDGLLLLLVVILQCSICSLQRSLDVHTKFFEVNE